MSAFVVSNITPSLKIDSGQRFIFGLQGSPEPLGSFKLDNIYAPILGSPSLTNFEIRNNTLSGYRWIHVTQDGETYGSFKLQKFLNASSTGVDVLSFNDDGSFNIPGLINAKYILQTPSVSLPDAQALSTLSTGLLKSTTGTGVLSIASPGVDYLPMSGGTLTGDLILNNDPTNPLGAVTRQYADAISQGLEFKNSCYAATTTSLTSTYNNGASGVGATLTNSGSLAVFSIDGVTPPINSRILVKNQATGSQNGIYTLTTVGNGSVAWVLTRSLDYNQISEIAPGDFIIVDNGTTNQKTGWIQTATINQIGVDSFSFSQFGTLGTVTNVSGTSGQINVTNGTSTPVISIDPNLNVPKIGIGITPSLDGRIDFANTSLDTKIRFYTNNTPGNTFDQSGIGFTINGGTFYHCPIGKSHLFFTGANGNNPVEINDMGIRVSGIGISSVDYRKIILWEVGNNQHQTNAIGVQMDGLPSNYILLRNQVSSINDSFIWNCGTSSSSSKELMRLNNSGGLVIKNQTAATVGNDNIVNFKLENSLTGGFALKSTLGSGGGFGDLKLNAISQYGDVVNFCTFGFSSLFGGVGFMGGETNITFGDTSIDALLSKVGVSGGPTNVADESSCIRAVSSNSSTKIEIKNTGASGRLYELRSNSDGSFGITDRTSGVSRILINVDGSLSDINSLKFTNDTLYKKIVLYDASGNDNQYYGIGVDNSELRYQAMNYHRFWLGTSPTTSYCGLSINSSGNIGIGNYQDSTLSRVFINGGPTLDAAGEESVLRVQNSNLSSTSVKIQIVHQNAKNWELRSNSNGSFEIYDRFGLASRFLINSSGVITTGVWNASVIPSQYGGTGVNNGGRTLQYNGNVAIGGTFTTNGTFSVNGNFSVNQSFSTNQPVNINGGFVTTGGQITLRTPSSTDVTLPTSGTIATLSNTLDQFGVPTANINLNSHKIINLATPTLGTDAATKAYVDSAVGFTFGPNVSLPYSQLNFNWSYASVTNPSPYEFVNNFTDSQISKNFKYRVLTNDISAREWNHEYTLIGNSDLNGIYKLNYNSIAGTSTPLTIQIYPFASSQNLMTIGVPVDMGGFEIRNALNPTTAQSLTTRNYVDTRTITLTGSVTGSSTLGSSIATSFSNSQNVNGNTQLFSFSNILTSSTFSIQNTNSSAVTGFRAGTSTDYAEIGYDGNDGYSYINFANSSNDRLAFRVNGSGVAALLQSGLFGIGTIAPTLAKLQIEGGVQNLVGEESAIRVRSSLSSVKIELQNTAVGGKLYELRSSSTGSFDITDRTGAATRYTIDTNGNHLFSNTIFGRRVSGLMTMQNNAVGTTVTTANTYYKVAGTTLSSNLNGLTSSSNRFTVSSTIPHIALLNVNFTAFHNGAGGDDMFFALYKNGFQISNTVIFTEGTNNSPKSHSISTLISMTTNDYIELWCSHSVNGKIVTVQNLMFSYTTT